MERHFALEFDHVDAEQLGRPVRPEFGRDRRPVAVDAAIGIEHALFAGVWRRHCGVLHLHSVDCCL
ncbi:hypothetical protein SDC9_207152 [bioreactor metagenome]|uniref:Uncharacterized protein n=1 Tax=bioreactor metagenome TaxID=1076179 RepID=A0A645J740_9ZZZZ